MNLNEIKQLLAEVAVIDNRKLTEQTAEAWKSILGFMPLDIAREALHLARKDDRINWLEPKHIASWAREAAFKMDRDNPKQSHPVAGSSQPSCKAHNALLTRCLPCSRQLHQYEVTEGLEGLLGFAQSEIYEVSR
jgi:hypothetical protein